MILACRICSCSVVSQTTRFATDSCSSCLHADWLTSGPATLARVLTKCGMIIEHLKPTHVGRSHVFTDSLPCSWSGRAMRHGDFLAPPRLSLHGPGSSKCARTVYKPIWLWPCKPLTVLCVPCHVATATARSRHRSRCVRSDLYRVCDHRVRCGA